MADNNPAETYRSAYNEVFHETERIQSLIDKLDRITTELRGAGWKSVGISLGSSSSVGFRNTPHGIKPLVLSDIPKAEEIHQAIFEWHRKRDNLDRLFSMISPKDRAGLLDPESLDS